MYGAIVTTPALSINVRVFEVVEAIRNGNMPRDSSLLLAMTRGNKLMRVVRRSAGKRDAISTREKARRDSVSDQRGIKPHHAR